MSQLTLNHTYRFRKTLRTQADFPIHVRFGKFFIMFAMLGLIGLLSFLYLTKFTQIHTKGYQLRKLEIAKQKLVVQREHASVAIAKEKSLTSVRDNAVALSMIPARSAYFVQRDGAVAQVTLASEKLR